MCYMSKLVLLPLLLAMTGCKKPGAELGGKYWVAGLTLPSGSTIVGKEESAVSDTNAA